MKGIAGVRILGQGELRDRPSEGIDYFRSLGLLDAFTIGAASKDERRGLIHSITAA